MIVNLPKAGRVFRNVCLAILAVGLLSGCPTLPDGTVPGGGGTGTGGGGGGGGGGSSSSSVAAELQEQLSLERINRARLKPVDEAARFGIALNEGVPADKQISTTAKQPLTLNATLGLVAEDHSQDMLDRNYFAHDTPEGVDPFTRFTNAGYAFTSAGENLAWRGTTGTLDEIPQVEQEHEDLFVDDGFLNRGHRTTMLTSAYREVGIGIRRGSYTNPADGIIYDSLMQTQDYGTSTADNTFVLGVVYGDSNGNGQYDDGEGTAGVAVTLGSVAAATNAAGGFSFEVTSAGTYTLMFVASGLSQAITISSGAPNIKVDLVDGTTLVINLGLGPLS